MTNEELAIRIKNGETELIEELWNQVRRFIKKQAIKWIGNNDSRNGYTAEDLVQSSYSAFLHAINYYDPDNEKDGSFLTALGFFLPRTFSSALKLDYQNQDKEPLNLAASLDNPLKENSNGDESDASLGDFIADDGAELFFLAVEKQIVHKNLCEILYPIMGSLTESQQEILYARYWLEQSCAKIGQEYGMSRQRVNQIEQRALEVLRCHPRIGSLKEFSYL